MFLVDAGDSLNGADAAPSASMEITATFFSVFSMFAISFSLLTINVIRNYDSCQHNCIRNMMNKKLGRPKIGMTKCQRRSVLLRGLRRRMQRQIDAAIRRSNTGKPDWVRKALLSAAGSDKSAS